MSEHISTNFDNGILRVTLNRPEKANALTHNMLLKLHEIFSNVNDNNDLRVVVITGSGEKAFCAGADLSELHTTPSNIWDEMSYSLNSTNVLTIAAINGPCIGGGMTLALGCDVRLCVPNAHFSYPVLRNNVIPGQLDCSRLNCLIGPGRSSLLLLGGVKVSSNEALDWGLVDGVVENDLFETKINEISETAVNADLKHLVDIKRSCRGGSI